MQDNFFCLDKRYYLVTGAAGLLGRQHCEAILSAQGIPVGIDLDQESLINMRDELKQIHNQDFPIFACSVTDIGQLNHLKLFLKKSDIVISGIINNAAINPTMKNDDQVNQSRLENYDLLKWDQELDVGLKGSYLVVRTFIEIEPAHTPSAVLCSLGSLG